MRISDTSEIVPGWAKYGSYRRLQNKCPLCFGGMHVVTLEYMCWVNPGAHPKYLIYTEYQSTGSVLVGEVDFGIYGIFWFGS